MDIRQLIYFATIVEEGSISAAAKKLHLSQPPLSYQLKLLEEELHLQLLQRGARGVQLTEAGKVLYKRAQGILELTERTQKELQAMAGGFAGTLHIGTVSSSGASLLDWRIPAFHEQYPQIGFAIHEGNTFELMEMLESGLIELAVVRTPFHDEQVDCRYLQQEPMIAAGIPSLFPAGTADSALKSFQKRHKLKADGELNDATYHKLTWEAFAKEGVSPQIFCLADDARTALMWAEAELGVAIVPQSAYRIMPHHRIIFAELCEPALRTRLAAISKKGASLSWPAQKFLEIFASVEPGR